MTEKFTGLRTINAPSKIDKPELETLSYKPKMSLKEAEQTAREYFKTSEQPDKNALLFEQINGCIKVTVGLLEQLEAKDTNRETQKQSCIWTFTGWRDNNLKHLQKALE